MEFVVLAIIVLILFFPRIRSHFVRDIPKANSSKEDAALARVRQIKYFYIHFGFYLLTIIAVLLLSQLVGNEQVAYITAVLWGLAVAIHAFVVFILNSTTVRNWEKRRLQAFLEEDESSSDP